MKPLREKEIIQVEVTNACPRECTNCSRFVGHHSKAYFMELDQIEEALLSLQDFPGYVGIMGGEPTLHPQFVEICGLVRKHISPEKRNLMTSGVNWVKYEKLIKKTFAEHVVYNDHSDQSQKHHPMLLGIRDVIDDQRFIEDAIANCWVDKRWAASVNPKGCFFCEIAAAMDMLFGGPGGLPVEKDWWKKDPSAFAGQQQNYCYQCGACVPYFPGKLVERQDAVSIGNYLKLERAGSPKVQDGRVRVVSEKISRDDLAAMAKSWQPWNHFGEMLREGTGKTQLTLYGQWFGTVLRAKKQLQARFWTFRRIEVSFNRLLWRIGLH